MVGGERVVDERASARGESSLAVRRADEKHKLPKLQGLAGVQAQNEQARDGWPAPALAGRPPKQKEQKADRLGAPSAPSRRASKLSPLFLPFPHRIPKTRERTAPRPTCPGAGQSWSRTCVSGERGVGIRRREGRGRGAGALVKCKFSLFFFVAVGAGAAARGARHATRGRARLAQPGPNIAGGPCRAN